jgi:hypothetical protein
VDILAVDAYSGMELCTPIFLGQASNKISRRENHFEKNSKLEKNTSLNKVQHKRGLLCGYLFDFGRNVNVVEEHF